MTQGEIKAAIKTKFDLLERARSDATMTDSDYRLYSTLLLQFYSMDTGRCNPSDAKLLARRLAASACEPLGKGPNA